MTAFKHGQIIAFRRKSMTAFKNGQTIAFSSDRKFTGVLRRNQGEDKWYLLVRSRDGRAEEKWRTVARLGLTPDAVRALVA